MPAPKTMNVAIQSAFAKPSTEPAPPHGRLPSPKKTLKIREGMLTNLGGGWI